MTDSTIDLKLTRPFSRAPSSWDPKDDLLLRHLKEEQKLGWKEIASHFTHRTPNACQFRWRRLRSGSLKMSAVGAVSNPSSPIHLDSNNTKQLAKSSRRQSSSLSATGGNNSLTDINSNTSTSNNQSPRQRSTSFLLSSSSSSAAATAAATEAAAALAGNINGNGNGNVNGNGNMGNGNSSSGLSSSSSSSASSGASTLANVNTNNGRQTPHQQQAAFLHPQPVHLINNRQRSLSTNTSNVSSTNSSPPQLASAPVYNNYWSFNNNANNPSKLSSSMTSEDPLSSVPDTLPSLLRQNQVSNKFQFEFEPSHGNYEVSHRIIPWHKEEDDLLMNRKERKLSFTELSILLPTRSESDIWSRINFLENNNNNNNNGNNGNTPSTTTSTKNGNDDDESNRGEEPDSPPSSNRSSHFSSFSSSFTRTAATTTSSSFYNDSIKGNGNGNPQGSISSSFPGNMSISHLPQLSRSLSISSSISNNSSYTQPPAFLTSRQRENSFNVSKESSSNNLIANAQRDEYLNSTNKRSISNLLVSSSPATEQKSHSQSQLQLQQHGSSLPPISSLSTSADDTQLEIGQSASILQNYSNANSSDDSRHSQEVTFKHTRHERENKDLPSNGLIGHKSSLSSGGAVSNRDAVKKSIKLPSIGSILNNF
ncbi:hypothetical protein PACTADRAFT_1947 [Pachysolen tannophilus NRRL Y-2460]|uniref:Uncharacterized protein n=1 Tax=Pachysolen tannophilus NRRL Y-2460 TaxID=669874 RepID=A0A1E4U059_PACTA|nr:hypothetical protein PACTADRAFT_1947 [Pachysolen tannophilus NRRL Y-2460]